ncbi:hypothetical protein N7456_004129 [Penicillium angulare]|uniref:Major facilitator superfamily (MFS) profile domain-containing protein n=1 Tax=Penicillium angulare TaxID=116970 RepID=A0A9W9FVZ7_9EURO|nr:hypothetical protein N7456_004129 [Penicillium angulare]
MNGHAGNVSPHETSFWEKDEAAPSFDSTRSLFHRITHPRRSLPPDHERAEIHDWDGPNDPENPFNWSKTYRWLLTITGCFMSIIVALPAGSYSGGQHYMSKQFHVKEKPFNNLMWATTTFQMGAAFLPPIFVPLTESWGRRPGYLVGYSLYWIWMFPSAFAPNFATLIVTRFFGGGAAASTINIVGGMIADIWPGGVARSRPMSLYVFSQITGISLGPFIGGGLQIIHIGNPWRWIFWVQLMWGLLLMPVFWFIMRETRGDVLLSKRARKIRQETGRVVYSRFELETPSALQRLKVSTTRPTRLLLTEPVVLFFTLWVSFAWGTLFLFFDSVSLTFRHNYKMDTFTIGLIELAVSVGAVIGILLNPIQDWLYARSARRDHETSGKPIPEARLYTAIPGSIIFTAGLFWYGWASVGDGKLHWIVPTLGIGCCGVGIYSILLSVLNYITDSYEKYAASALSSTSLGRNIISGFLPLGSLALFDHLGFGWAGTLLGFIGAGLSIVPVVLILKGPAIRRRSPFMRESMFEEDR